MINQQNQSELIKAVINDQNNPWMKQLRKTIETTDVNMEYLKARKAPAKKYIDKKMTQYQVQKIYTAAESKSKVRDYICHRSRDIMLKRPRYMNHLTRNQCSSIFAIRARMIKTKGNYKNKYDNLKCRWCESLRESHKHVMEECPGIKHKIGNQRIAMFF